VSAVQASFRARVRSGAPLVGTFVKTASHQTLEVLGTTGLDFTVIDAEHAPFGRNQLDVALLAARAARMPTLVRLQDTAPDRVLDALDMGATGVLVPHARSAAGVRDIVAMARYRDGVRGFSNSPRAGGYGTVGMAAHLETSDGEGVVICQVEDREAVEDIEAIAAEPGVDCLFLGKADLAVSYRVFDIHHPAVTQAVERTCRVCRAAGKAVGVFVASADDIARHRDLGASLFVVGSDQSLLRAQAATLSARFRDFAKAA
jgi:2-keto-3-deoxy-L-rhamnonate aldolase RhmA